MTGLMRGTWQNSVRGIALFAGLVIAGGAGAQAWFPWAQPGGAANTPMQPGALKQPMLPAPLTPGMTMPGTAMPGGAMPGAGVHGMGAPMMNPMR